MLLEKISNSPTGQSMIGDKISVKFFDIGQGPVVKFWPINKRTYVEELTYDILQELNVGPVSRMLFGLRLTNKPSIWLAPNTRINNLSDLFPPKSHPDEPQLELRMRFRPASFEKLMILDRTAFELAFSQIRFDFVYTRFNGDKKGNLVGSAVLGMVGLDMLRYGLENRLDIKTIYKQVDKKKIIPQKISILQRSLLFPFNIESTLQNFIQSCLESCSEDVLKIKRIYIQLFTLRLCQDYGSETYRVTSIEDGQLKQLLDVRLRYIQTTQETRCVLESRSISKKALQARADWVEICDIYTINYGILSNDCLKINRFNGETIRIRFKTSTEARSFISAVSGYYRLMRKWQFNFCREVVSPDLEFLKKIKCHGPIGFETMKSKLTLQEEPGTYLVRRSLDYANRYIIDVILPYKTRFSIDVEHNLEHDTYRVLNPCTKYLDLSVCENSTTTNEDYPEVILSQRNYSNLNGLIDDLMIKNSDESFLLRLEHLIPPNEHEDYPALLLSMPEEKFSIFETNISIQSDWEIDYDRISIGEEIGRGTGGVVFKGTMTHNSREEVVAVKQFISRSQDSVDLMKEFEILKNLNHKNIVKILGIVHGTKTMLVFEYVPLGSLLVFLKGTSQDQLSKLPLKKFATDIAEGMEYLEKERVVHRDLALRNILLVNGYDVKIGDFGLAQFLGESSHYQLKTDRALPLKWYAPEVLKNWQFSHKTDVWSFGIVLWEIYSGGCHPQYSGHFKDLPETLEHERLRMPKDCPEYMYSLMNACWSYDPDQRDNFSKICEKLSYNHEDILN